MSDLLVPAAASCAEAIALLYLLHTVPTMPSSNSANALPTRSNRYTLTLETEKTLASTLAFLSHAEDDSDHIPAVCVYEDLHLSTMSILLAVNQIKYDDGVQILQRLKTNLERVLKVLSHVVDDDSPATEDDVFSAIVAMCSQRILCRLRLVAKRKGKSKQGFKEALQHAITAVRQLGKSNDGKQKSVNKTLQPVAASFLVRAREVVQLADSWTKHQTLIRLGNLVRGVSNLWRVERLQDLLEVIPNRDMDPSARKSLYNIIGKVSRYQEAASFLRRIARRFPMVRRMTVISVSLPKEAFYKLPADQHQPVLLSTLARFAGSPARQWSFAHISRLLSTSELGFNRLFAQQTRKILKEAKVHAEIQLIFYCELKTPNLPPRVVCSSKDACFLCNAFIALYGKLYTPRSHGRLYPAWRLPRHPSFTDLERRFSEMLENRARESVSTLLVRKQKTIYPDPCESTLFTLPLSSSTIRSFPTSSLADVLDIGAATFLPAGNLETLSTSTEPRTMILSTCSPQNNDLPATSRLFLKESDSKASDGSSPSTKSLSKIVVEKTDSVTAQELADESVSELSNTSDIVAPFTQTKDRTYEDQPGCSSESKSSSSYGLTTGDTHNVNQTRGVDCTLSNLTVSSSSNGVLCSAQIQTPVDFDRQGQDMLTGPVKGCETQVRTEVGGHTTQGSERSGQCLRVDHRNSFSPKLDLRGLELFFEAEPPSTAVVLVSPCPLSQPPSVMPVVDVEELRPGNEFVVDTGVEQSQGANLCLTMKDELGTSLQWKVEWKIM